MSTNYRSLICITITLVFLSSGILNAHLAEGGNSAQNYSGDDPVFIFDTITRVVAVQPGDDFYIYFDQDERKFFEKPPPGLPDECIDALNLVPSWLAGNLTYKFLQLNNEHQVTYADLIINSPDVNYIDEIAFCVAHSAVENLQNDDMFPELFTHNAELIYENDKFLNYVDIVEKDDYTTVVYKDQNNINVELPRDIYYWYIVHPKLSDELPTYVDPEYDFTTQPPFNRNYGVAPPAGKFWRDWLFNHNDTAADYDGPAKKNPLLKDLLSDAGNLWDAVKAANNWMSNSMAFTSDNERPIQPVRIYRKHIGRCGEYQDMRNAIARAGLIPSTCTLNSAEDHVWNEFWDGRWIHWDGSIDKPNSYDNDLGGYFHKDISSVHNTRGDSHIVSVTPKYTPVSNFTATVIDSDGDPVGGALVTIETENFYNEELRSTTVWGTTDFTGNVTLPLGNLRNYWAQVSTDDLGSEPVYSSTQVIQNSSIGTEYFQTFELPLAAPNLNARDIDPPVIPDPKFKMEIEIEVVENTARVRNPYSSERGDLHAPGGNIDFFVSDATNYNLFNNGLVFNAYDVAERSESGKIEFVPPSGDQYFTVLSNGFSQATTKLVRITINVISEIKINIRDPSDGLEISIDSPIAVEGTAWAPGGIDSVEVCLGDSDEWFGATDVSGSDEEVYSQWNYILQSEGQMPSQSMIYARVESDNKQILTKINISFIDDTAPQVKINKPEDNSKIELGDNCLIEGTVLDNVAIRSLELILDDDEAGKFDLTSLVTNGQFSYTLQSGKIGEGDHSIKLRAMDTSQNTAWDTISIVIQELKAPDIKITLPPANSVFKLGKPIQLTGYAHDNNQIAKLELTVDNVLFIDIFPNLDQNGQFSSTIDTEAHSLIEGSHMLKITASDLSENSASDQLQIILDDTPPEIDIRSPSSDELFAAGDDIFIDGTCVDDCGISRLEFVLDSKTALDITSELSNGRWSYEYGTTSRIDGGEHTITITATDLAGFVTIETFTVQIDAEDPRIQIDRIDGSIIIGEFVTISGTVSDDTEISSLLLSIDDSVPKIITNGISGGDWEYTLDTSNLDPGKHTITIIATDPVDNLAADDIQIKLVEGDIEPSDGSSGDQQETAFEGSDLFSSYLFWILIIIGVVISLAVLFSSNKNKEDS